MNFAMQGVWAIGLIFAAFALSSWQRLGLEGNLMVAAGRAVIQLAVVGYVLAVIFAPPQSPSLIVFVLAILVIVSAIVTRNRISEKLPLPGVVGSLLITTIVTVAYVQLIVVQPQTWYEPRFLIAFGAIVLSQAMNAAAIAGERLFTALSSRTLEIETRLSLGATPAQAIESYRKEAIRAGVLPVINAMAIVGLATIPEMVSGQLLGGAEPIQAIAFQIVILMMVTFATLLVTVLLTSAIGRQFFNAQAQLIRW